MGSTVDKSIVQLIRGPQDQTQSCRSFVDTSLLQGTGELRAVRIADTLAIQWPRTPQQDRRHVAHTERSHAEKRVFLQWTAHRYRLADRREHLAVSAEAA